MFTLSVENEGGKRLTLTQDESNYQIVEIDGLNPANGIINTSTVAGMDGGKFSSSKLDMRNLVITVRINGDVERNRLRLYQFFRTKHWCKIYYKNGSRDVYIEGYVETNECGLFTDSEQMQVSIVCPDPYFKSMTEIYTDISEVLGMFVFPFAFGADGVIPDTITDEAIEFSSYVKNRITNIYNAGGDDTGLIIVITCTGTVKNPTIYDVNTREGFSLKIDLVANDVITINTNRGQKGVTLQRSGVISSQINAVQRDSVWLNLASGENQFIYEADTGSENMNIVFKHRTNYEAV